MLRRGFLLIRKKESSIQIFKDDKMQAIIKSKDGIKNTALNRRKSIHEKCLNCSCWIPKEVSNCKINECPLFSFRMSKGKQDAVKRQKSIRTYCLDCMNGQVGAVSDCPSSDCPLFIYRKGGLNKALGNYMKKNFHSEANILSDWI